ncbi:MAG: hypothetical protein ACRDD1_20235, partial [Planctomycetia bacterium]
MAKSSDQSITIALTMFVLMTIGFAVGSYYFYDKLEEATKQAKDAQDKETKAMASADAGLKEYLELRRRIFSISDPSDHPAVAAIVKRELDPEGALLNTMPELTELRAAKNAPRRNAYETYTAGLKTLHETAKLADEEIAAREDKKKNLETELDGLRAVFKAQSDKALADQAEKAKAIRDDASKILGDIDQKDTEMEDYRKRYLEAVAETLSTRRQFEKENALGKQRKADIQLNIKERRRFESQSEQTSFGGRDGSVVAVTDAGRKIYIDVGLKQGVRAALMFGVYGLDVGGNPLQYPKAAIEVSEVLDQNSSVARLIFASVSDPILPGDLLFNPIWSIGDNETIAVAGVIDLTGDGRPDNAEFKRVVEENGGRVES